MHYYQFNIGDYAKSTKHLSPMEDLAYRRMLDLFYDSEKPLPCEIPAIARLIVMREYQEEIRQVLIEYWEETEHGWINKRANEDLTAYKEKSDKASASAKARWAKRKESEPKANAMRTHNEGNANHETITKKHKPRNKKQSKASRLPEDFSLTEKMRDWYSSQTDFFLPVDKITAQWCDSMLAKGYEYTDWTAAWRNGMNNAHKWHRENNPGQQQQAPKRNGFDTGFEK